MKPTTLLKPAISHHLKTDSLRVNTVKDSVIFLNHEMESWSFWLTVLSQCMCIGNTVAIIVCTVAITEYLFIKCGGDFSVGIRMGSSSELLITDTANVWKFGSLLSIMKPHKVW